MKAVLRGRRYTLRWVNHLGPVAGADCEAPTQPKPVMRFCRNLPPEDELRLYLHESLHACMWDLAEETVDEVSKDIGAMLWRLGYRRVGPGPASARGGGAV